MLEVIAKYLEVSNQTVRKVQKGQKVQKENNYLFLEKDKVIIIVSLFFKKRRSLELFL